MMIYDYDDMAIRRFILLLMNCWDDYSAAMFLENLVCMFMDLLKK